MTLPQRANQRSSAREMPYTLSFTGTGTVTFPSGSLRGTGTNDRVRMTFTPPPGPLKLTATGDVRYLQLEKGPSVMVIPPHTTLK